MNVNLKAVLFVSQVSVWFSQTDLDVSVMSINVHLIFYFLYSMLLRVWWSGVKAEQ